METIKTLEQAPTLTEFSRQVRNYENHTERYEVAAYNLKLYPNSKIGINGKNLEGKFSLSPQVGKDLARLAKIPITYFKKCDPELQSISFNHRLQREVPGEEPLQVVLQDGTIDRVLDGNLLSMSRLPILASVSNSIPAKAKKEDLKVIIYAWDEQFDISIISPDLKCEPRKGDIVAFGVSITEGRDGSIQVQGAAFRYYCSNGAINRICNGNRHRLRRPIRPDHQQQFLQKIERFVEEAWRQWQDNAEGLLRLKNTALDSGYSEALRSRLRQAPFFLSLKIIDQVLERLAVEVSEHNEALSMYAMWNAITWLATHNLDLPLMTRSRLRLASGEFTRNKSRFCNACRQLLIA